MFTLHKFQLIEEAELIYRNSFGKQTTCMGNSFRATILHIVFYSPNKLLFCFDFDWLYLIKNCLQ